MLFRLAARRATEAELGDVAEEYLAKRRSAAWLIGQVMSSAWRRRSPLTVTERGAEMLSNVRHDIRYALRTLARNPGFAVAAIVPIALGIGINTAVFSILNSVAWRSLPAPEADALVSMHQQFRHAPRRTVYGARTMFSIPEYRAYRDEAGTLSGLMAYSRRWTVTLGRESPQEVEGVLVTCNYFEVLGVTPVIGAGFTPSNCSASNAASVVVLSHALWNSAFAGDPQILQKPIVLIGREVTVAGVAPAGFDGVDMAKSAWFAPTSMASVLGPAQEQLHENPHVSWLTLIGRRRDDATLAQVRADLARVAGRIDREQPGRTTSLIVEPAAALSLPVQRRMILRGAAIVLTAFGLVLLIAAANVANILLARAATRTREVAIRVSIGATRGRLIRQLLTESAVIALAGAACGTFLFWWLFQALIPRLLASVPGADAMRVDVTPDRTVFWFALGLTTLTALACGVVPAWQASAGDVNAAMKQDGGGAGRGWMRGTLVGAQIALCTMLLIPTGLLARALYAAHTFDPGFDHQHVATVSVDLRGPRYEGGQAAPFRAQWLDRIRTAPGVEALAEASRIPLSPGRSQTTFRIGRRSRRLRRRCEHRLAGVLLAPRHPDRPRPRLHDRRIPGRPHHRVDGASLLPGEDPLGRTIAMDNERRVIVGIVRDAHISQAQDANSSYVYVPATRGSQRGISVLARSRSDPGRLAATVRAETARMDPSLVVNVQSLSANVGLLQTLSQIAASVAGILSLLALALAAIGLYGVVAYVVSRRLREVGVRMALGAGARDVQRLILRQTLRPVLVGLSVGVAVAAAVSRLLQSVLFGVSPSDPIAFVGAPVLMLIVAVAATSLPTRRAVRVNPVSVLRSE